MSESNREQGRRLFAKKGERSFVWKFFRKSDLNSKEETIPCQLCHQSVSFRGSTTATLIWHLNKKHDICKTNYKLFLNMRNRVSIENDSSSSEYSDAEEDSNKSESKSPKDTEITDRLVDFLVMTNQPLSLLEEQSFIDLVGELNPTFKMPSKGKVKNKLIPAKVGLRVNEMLLII